MSTVVFSTRFWTYDSPWLSPGFSAHFRYSWNYPFSISNCRKIYIFYNTKKHNFPFEPFSICRGCCTALFWSLCGLPQHDREGNEPENEGYKVWSWSFSKILWIFLWIWIKFFGFFSGLEILLSFSRFSRSSRKMTYQVIFRSSLILCDQLDFRCLCKCKYTAVLHAGFCVLSWTDVS